MGDASVLFDEQSARRIASVVRRVEGDQTGGANERVPIQPPAIHVIEITDAEPDTYGHFAGQVMSYDPPTGLWEELLDVRVVEANGQSLKVGQRVIGRYAGVSNDEWGVFVAADGSGAKLQFGSVTNGTPDSDGRYAATLETYDPAEDEWTAGDEVLLEPALGGTLQNGLRYPCTPTSDAGVYLAISDANQVIIESVPVYFGGMLNTSGQVIKGVKEFRDTSKWRLGGDSTSGTNVGSGFVQIFDKNAYQIGQAQHGPGISQVTTTSSPGPTTSELTRRTIAGLDANGSYFELSRYTAMAGGVAATLGTHVAEPGSLFTPQWASYLSIGGTILVEQYAQESTHRCLQFDGAAARLYHGGVYRGGNTDISTDHALGTLYCGGEFCLTFLTHYPHGPFGPRFGVDRFRSGIATRLWGIDRIFQPGDLPVVAGGIVVGYWRESGGPESPDPTDEDPTPDEPALPLPDPWSITYNCVEGKCVAVVGTSGTYATLAACQAASCEGTPPESPPDPPPPVPPVITWDCACVEDAPYDGSAYRGVAVPNYEGTGKYTDNLAANQGCFDWGLENCKAESKAWYQVCPEGKVGAAVCEQLTAEEATERGIVSGPHADKSTCEGAFPAFCSEAAFRSGDVTVTAAAPAMATSEKIPLPCVHRGESTGEQVQCRACINKTTEVFGCAVHGECTVDRSAYPRKFRVGGQLTFKEIPLCGSCKDRKAPEAKVVSS